MFAFYRLKFLLVPVLFLLLCVVPGRFSQADAASARELDARTQDSLQEFQEQVPDARNILKDASGILVFPGVWQAGLLGLGGEYGQGSLLAEGATQGYYRMVSGSVGFQLGAQKKTLIFAFLTPKALADFRKSSGWEIGADASVAVVTAGAEGTINTKDLENKPVVAFVVDQKGLMYNLSLEGTKITPITKK